MMRERPTSSLYRCEKCGDVVRARPGSTSLGHIHRGDAGEYLGKDAEGRYIEFEDDGRELDQDHDMTHPDTRWMA